MRKTSTVKKSRHDKDLHLPGRSLLVRTTTLYAAKLRPELGLGSTIQKTASPPQSAPADTTDNIQAPTYI
jgi:hypothetical protein